MWELIERLCHGQFSVTILVREKLIVEFKILSVIKLLYVLLLSIFRIPNLNIILPFCLLIENGDIFDVGISIYGVQIFELALKFESYRR